MELATYIGISITEFWDITPYELNIALRSFNKRKNDELKEYEIKLENERRLLTLQAYQISRWVWQKKVDIDKALDIPKEKKAMSDEQMLAQVKMLNSLFGGEVKVNGTEE
jgi:hypothetical protein